MDYENFVASLSLEDRKRLCKKIDKFIDYLIEISGDSYDDISEELDVVHELNLLNAVANPPVPVLSPGMPKYGSAEEKIRINRFSVYFPDGYVINERQGALSYIDALRYMGLERVEASFMKTEGGKLLVTKTLPKKKDAKRYELVDGYYVYTFKSNRTRVEYLRKISNQLGIKISIYCN